MPKNTKTQQKVSRMRPALSQEAREQQLAALAMDLLEERLRNGEATSQEIVYCLKVASQKEKLEKDILEKQKDLIGAKTESLQSTKRIESLYAEAMNAMRKYSGAEVIDDDSDLY